MQKERERLLSLSLSLSHTGFPASGFSLAHTRTHCALAQSSARRVSLFRVFSRVHSAEGERERVSLEILLVSGDGGAVVQQ